jgi:hypothetical protein
LLASLGDIAQLQNEWPLHASLGETSSLDCNMNAHCWHLWERDSSICKMVIACIFGREIARLQNGHCLHLWGPQSKWYLYSLFEKSDDGFSLFLEANQFVFSRKSNQIRRVP